MGYESRAALVRALVVALNNHTLLILNEPVYSMFLHDFNQRIETIARKTAEEQVRYILWQEGFLPDAHER